MNSFVHEPKMQVDHFYGFSNGLNIGSVEAQTRL